VTPGLSSAGPLSGVRILEIGHMLAGPYATMMLADLGAEVTKIEPPGGDISRQVSDSYFASLNRGKRSVCIDLTSDAGRHRLGELAAESHALLANLKPSAIQRYGLTYDALRRYNERIVCVALTGYGLAAGDDPAFDYVDHFPIRFACRRCSKRIECPVGVLSGYLTPPEVGVCGHVCWPGGRILQTERPKLVPTPVIRSFSRRIIEWTHF
jgi:CoA-transferase family III